MRKDFLEDQQFAGCSECWRQQNMGLKSMRYDSYQYEVSEAQVQNPLSPLRIEINASNVCNLRCRICYPNASSKWIKEGKDIYGQQETLYKNLEGENMTEVKKWAPNLEEVCFFGGEPLLSDDNLALLDYFIEQGFASNIALLFNTNGTIFTDDIAQKLTKFKRVRMYFSIDDIGERFEYQRSGAKWSEVEANIRKAYQLSKSPEGKRIDFKICNTVSSMNIYYFPEFFAYFGKEFPGLKIFWNLIFDPWRLSIQILPPAVKNVIRERLKNYVKATYKMTEGDTKTIEELVTYLDFQEPRPFEEFFRLINRHDVYRKESFATTFPEFWALIAPYQPDDVQMGTYDTRDILQQEMMKNPKDYPLLKQILKFQEMKLPYEEFYGLVGKKGLKELMLGAMNEIAMAKSEITFGLKTAELDAVLNDEQVLEDFTSDYMISGPFKFQEAIQDLEEGKVASRIRRKYFRAAIA
jgi:MoaA/NifB/PqqE/SkfB family radical SAM enzyme